VALDAPHGEVFVVQSYSNAVLVFDRKGQGDVAPIRVLQGPDTTLDSPIRVAVDPVHNLMAVTIGSGVLVFDRTAEGNTPPKAVITGPKTGIAAGFRASRVTMYPEKQKMFVSVAGSRTRAGVEGSYIAVWKYGDTGDVAPVAVLKGPKTRMRNPFGGVALIPDAKELVILENLHPPGVFVFHLPEVFE
jgi:DNA-binding beta-propeller fold protein YncE